MSRTEITMECQHCHARVTLPLPDGYLQLDGTLIDADQISAEEVLAAFVSSLGYRTCPHCESEGTLRLVATEVKTSIPVYIGYTLYLERYVEVEAGSMDEAKALVYQMVREGRIQRPRYTEGLDDWTEITDLPNARSHFIIDGEDI
jgi:hypothetical protein